MPLLTHTRRASVATAVLLVAATAASAAAVSPFGFSTTRPNGQGKVLVVGDSLTVGASTGGYRSATFLRDAINSMKRNPTDGHAVWSGAVIDARVGRFISEGRTVIQTKIANDPSVTAVVVALGTNDMTGRLRDWAALVKSVLAAAAGRPVLWINVEFGTTRPGWNTRAVTFNRILELVALDPATNGQLTVANWAGFYPNYRPELTRYAGDGVHLNPRGYLERAKWMIRVMAPFAARAIDATTTTTSSSTTTTTTQAPPPPP